MQKIDMPQRRQTADIHRNTHKHDQYSHPTQGMEPHMHRHAHIDIRFVDPAFREKCWHAVPLFSVSSIFGTTGC